VAGSGIRRKVDDLGRVVIPAGIRRTLNMREGDTVEVTVDGERVVLSKPRDACVFCGREDDTLQRFRGRLVCRECVSGLGDVDERLRATEREATRDSAAARPPAPPEAPRTPAPVMPTPVAAHEPREPAAGAPTGAAEPEAQGRRAPSPVRPAWATGGPIDGDALAREAHQRPVAPSRPTRPSPGGAQTTAGVGPPHLDPHHASARGQVATDDGDADGSDAEPDGDAPRRPPYPPASTTAW
jgi:AbrB family transcriptional regulator, transcriptional pleiotropic regulator of transition state genes